METIIMKQTRILFAVSLLLASASSTFAAEQPTLEEQRKALASLKKNDPEQYNKEKEAVLKDLVLIFDEFSGLLQGYQLVIANDKIRTLDPNDLRRKIFVLQELVAQCRNHCLVVATERDLVAVCHLTKSMMNHLLKALEQGLFELNEFIPSRPIFDKEVDLYDVYVRVIENKALFKTLEDNSKNIGLRFYNRAYRKFDSLFIKPVIKYNLVPLVAKVTAAGLTAAHFFIYNRTDNRTIQEKQSDLGEKINGWKHQKMMYSNQNGEQNPHLSNTWDNLIDKAHQKIDALENEKNIPTFLDNPWIQWLQYKIIGFAPKYEERSGRLDALYHEDHPLRLFGTLEHHIVQSARGMTPVGTALAGITLAAFKDQALAALGATINAVLYYHNWLKGGAFFKESTKEKQLKVKHTFEDVIGLEHQKEVLRLIVRYLEDPERFERAKLAPEKGILFSGPTRTGKTYLAEALQGEIQRMLERKNDGTECRFFSIPASEIRGKQNITYWLTLAQSVAPCVIFIDEIDMLNLQRTGDREALGDFLSALSGITDKNPEKQVILLAATNKPENLDVSLRQAGRFGIELRFEYPSQEERLEHLAKKFDALGINTDTLDLAKIARESEGCSYQELESFIKHVSTNSSIFSTPVNQMTLESSFDEVVRKILPESTKIISKREQNTVIVHRAGQALISTLIESSALVSKVTINPVMPFIQEESVWNQYYKKHNNADGKNAHTSMIKHGEIFTYHEHDSLGFASTQEKAKQCKVLLAGHIAEEMLLGSASWPYNKEAKEIAFEIALEIIAEGINIQDLPNAQKEPYYKKATDLLEQYKKEVRELLNANKDRLLIFCYFLEGRRSLNSQEIIYLTKKPLNELTAQWNKIQADTLQVAKDNKLVNEAEAPLSLNQYQQMLASSVSIQRPLMQKSSKGIATFDLDGFLQEATA